VRLIEQTAELSVVRGCSFAALGILTTMVGLSGDLALMLKTGGLLTLLTSAVLQLKAWHATTRPYKTTELWIMLEPAERPSDVVAQQVLGAVLREVYIRFAMRTALIAACFLAGAILASLAAPTPA
jgi:hypothetical protein